MPTTSPDDLVTPDLDQKYALVQHMAALATKVQDTFERRGNMYKGSAVDRIAFTSAAPAGTHWQDTDQQRLEWTKVGGTWAPSAAIVSGTALQREGFVTPPENLIWNDTNGDRKTWIRQNGAWRIFPPITRHTESPSDVLSTEAGWRVTGGTYRERGGIAQLNFGLERTGADIPGTASGNIANQQFGTIRTGYRPVARVSSTNSETGKMVSGLVTHQGGMYITATVPNQPIKNGETMSFTFMYFLEG